MIQKHSWSALLSTAHMKPWPILGRAAATIALALAAAAIFPEEAVSQISQRRCETCAQAGLSILMWKIMPEPPTRDARGRVLETAGYEGRIYFYFRNIGTSNWKVEWVNCNFLDSNNNILFYRSFDLQKFVVSRDTDNIESDPYGLARYVERMKAQCWIQDAVR